MKPAVMFHTLRRDDWLLLLLLQLPWYAVR